MNPRRLNLINWLTGMVSSSNEEDIGGVAKPSGIRTPSGTKLPGQGIKGPMIVHPRRPSKDAKKRGRAPSNFAR